MSLFTPAGLWALLALAVPILIHLFNRSRGRLVRIGHIDLIRQARRLRVSEVRLAQWLLLLLRLGIFTLAALLLAGLARPGLQSSSTATAYVTPAWIRTASPASLDELIKTRQQGTRIKVLQPGFVPLDRNVATDIRQTPLDATNINSVWPLLAERLSVEHHSGPVDVYATDFLLQFGHSWTALPGEVNWNIAHPEAAPALNSWPASVVIAHDRERRQDAEYFRAALASLKAHRIPGLSWELVEARHISAQQLNADWLIFLSGNELTADQQALISTATTVLMDGDGDRAGDPPHSDLPQSSEAHVTLPFYPFSAFSLVDPGTSVTSSDAVLLLTTADGQPVLQETRAGPVRILSFNGRFNPQWSTVTQQAEFPELLLHLMLSRQQQTGAFAGARINPQLLRSGSDQSTAGIPLPRRSLQSLLAMLLALLWIAERWLSERKRNEPR